MIKPQHDDFSNCESIARIEAIDDVNRSNVVFSLFGKNHILAEQLVYKWMDTLSQEYKGGYWRIYQLSNGGFYMAPARDKGFTVYCPGFGDEVHLSADAAGLVACLFAINQLANQTHQDSLIRLYYLVRDYALIHPEVEGILRAID